jgi:hypothetical protein
MGAFIVNINVRTNDRQAVERQLADLNAWVTSAKNGWISVYEEQASTQDERRIRDLSARLSTVLDVAVIAFLVHDSDFVCYWLFDAGRLVDEFNSCPDYFDDGAGDDETADNGPSAGRPQVLLKYCPPGTQLDDVQEVLGDTEHVFAEEQLTKLAELLGIDQARATTNYSDLGGELDPSDLEATFLGASPPASRGFRGPRRARFPAIMSDDDADEDDDEDAGSTPGAPGGLASNILKMFGLGGAPAPSDPQVERLVQAASDNNIAEIDQLVAAGANINGQAPLKLKPSSASSPLAARMLAGGGLSFAVTPLLAAVANKQLDAARRLLELGADAKIQHPMFGTPVHAAAAGGVVDLLRLVLDAGADVNALNAQRQTPLQCLRYFRQMTSQLANLASLGAALGRSTQAALEKAMPSPAALDECENLLRERGGQ